MKVDRAAGLNAALRQNMYRMTMSLDGKHLSSTNLDADRQAFEQQLAREPKDQGSGSREDNDRPQQSNPFELLAKFQTPPEAVSDTGPCQRVTEILFDIVQQVFVSDERASRRQVSMVLTEDTLPGVTLSVFEEDGRVVADFACAVDDSRTALCQIAERLALALADRLSRNTRICVGTDDPEDPCTFQKDGAPIAGTLVAKESNTVSPAESPVAAAVSPAHREQDVDHDT